MEKKATLILPNRIEIDLEDFDLSLGEMIALAQEHFDDPQITPENFGPLKHFFFVNSTTGSLIDDQVELDRALSTLFIHDRNTVELRLCNPPPEPNGEILNPMRGVKTYVK